VVWLPTASAEYRLNIRVNGIHIKGSPFTAEAAAGSIDPSRSTIKGEVGPVQSTCRAGDTVRFTIEARDQHGNLANYPPLDRVKYDFKVTVGGPGAVSSPPTACISAPPLIGACTKGGIEAPPFRAPCRAPFERRFVADCMHALSLTPAPVHACARACCSQVDVDKDPLLNGLQPVGLPFQIVGEYWVEVRGQCGKLVKGGRFKIECLRTPVEARFCFVPDVSTMGASGAALKKAEAGRTMSFDIESRDPYGNRCEALPELQKLPNCAFSLKLDFREGVNDYGDETIIGENRAYDEAKTTISGSVAALEELGTFIASYKVLRAGKFALSIEYNQAPLRGSPFTLEVVPGPAHAKACMRLHCADSKAPLPILVAGNRASFLLLARDNFNNPRLVGGETTLQAGLVAVQGPEKVGCDIVDKGDGTYEIFYSATVTGEYMCSVNLNNEPVKGAPFKLKVQPGPTHAPTCIVSGFAMKTGQLDTLEAFMLEARDALNNPRGYGCDKVVCVIKGPGGKPPAPFEDDPRFSERSATVRDCEDGHYELSYCINTIGRYKIYLSIADAADHNPPQPLRGSPFDLAITGNRASAKESKVKKAPPKATAGEEVKIEIDEDRDCDSLMKIGTDWH